MSAVVVLSVGFAMTLKSVGKEKFVRLLERFATPLSDIAWLKANVVGLIFRYDCLAHSTCFR